MEEHNTYGISFIEATKIVKVNGFALWFLFHLSLVAVVLNLEQNSRLFRFIWQSCKVV